ncbi:MAG TPA: MEDS domain-containing protein, partial [Vicinamibacterales bacterium]|nr:MEDS domain-containing protein [Vicinamibacterales bacterium]
MNLESVGQGDHLCMYYDSTEQRSAVVAEYVRLGLEKNERCLCVADEQALPGIVLALSRAGVEVPHERRRGRLLLLSPRDAHLQGGRFDAEGMMTLLDDAVEQAVDDGFNGLRAVGDMSWILDGVPGTDRVFEYEAMMN